MFNDRYYKPTKKSLVICILFSFLSIQFTSAFNIRSDKPFNSAVQETNPKWITYSSSSSDLYNSRWFKKKNRAAPNKFVRSKTVTPFEESRTNDNNVIVIKKPTVFTPESISQNKDVLLHPSLSSILNASCSSHRKQFDLLHRAQTVLTLDLFFAALNTPMTPAGGTMLGTIRHRLLCAPWDDDLDFNIPTYNYNLLLHADTFSTSSIYVTDISTHQLGQSFKANILFSNRCRGHDMPAAELCPKITTFKIVDPSINDVSTEDAVLFHQFFKQTNLVEVCLSIMYLKYGFAKILIHDHCSLKTKIKGKQPIKVMDVFPLSFATNEWTCPNKDYISGIPSPRCVARALSSQPWVIGSARMLKVENGNVQLLVPQDIYAKAFLSGNYGDNWEKKAMICPHNIYSDYKKCAKVVQPTSMVEIDTLMSEIPECYGMDSSSNARTVSTETLVQKLRAALYLRVAKKYASQTKDQWTPIYYYRQLKIKTRSLTGERGVRFTKIRALLPSPGIVEYANEEGGNKGNDVNFYGGLELFFLPDTIKKEVIGDEVKRLKELVHV